MTNEMERKIAIVVKSYYLKLSTEHFSKYSISNITRNKENPLKTCQLLQKKNLQHQVCVLIKTVVINIFEVFLLQKIK